MWFSAQPQLTMSHHFFREMWKLEALKIGTQLVKLYCTIIKFCLPYVWKGGGGWLFIAHFRLLLKFSKIAQIIVIFITLEMFQTHNYFIFSFICMSGTYFTAILIVVLNIWKTLKCFPTTWVSGTKTSILNLTGLFLLQRSCANIRTTICANSHPPPKAHQTKDYLRKSSTIFAYPKPNGIKESENWIKRI